MTPRLGTSAYFEGPVFEGGRQVIEEILNDFWREALGVFKVEAQIIQICLIIRLIEVVRELTIRDYQVQQLRSVLLRLAELDLVLNIETVEVAVDDAGFLVSEEVSCNAAD